MAKIIMFGNMKGGIGKSTVTLLTATAFAQAPFNKKVIVLDLDRQRSLSELRELDKQETSTFSYQIRSCSVTDLNKEYRIELDKDFDLIFLDTGGKLDNNLPFEQQEITPVLLLTDVLLVPFVAGNFGTDATLKYLQYALQVQQSKKSKGHKLDIIGFVNMYIKQQTEDKQLLDYLSEISSETGLKFMSNKLGFYTAYRGADTIKSLYKDNASTAQERNFKMFIKELEKTL